MFSASASPSTVHHGGGANDSPPAQLSDLMLQTTSYPALDSTYGTYGRSPGELWGLPQALPPSAYNHTPLACTPPHQLDNVSSLQPTRLRLEGVTAEGSQLREDPGTHKQPRTPTLEGSGYKKEQEGGLQLDSPDTAYEGLMREVAQAARNAWGPASSAHPPQQEHASSAVQQLFPAALGARSGPFDSRGQGGRAGPSAPRPAPQQQHSEQATAASTAFPVGDPVQEALARMEALAREAQQHAAAAAGKQQLQPVLAGSAHSSGAAAVPPSETCLTPVQPSNTAAAPAPPLAPQPAPQLHPDREPAPPAAVSTPNKARSGEDAAAAASFEGPSGGLSPDPSLSLARKRVTLETSPSALRKLLAAVAGQEDKEAARALSPPPSLPSQQQQQQQQQQQPGCTAAAPAPSSGGTQMALPEDCRAGGAAGEEADGAVENGPAGSAHVALCSLSAAPGLLGGSVGAPEQLSKVAPPALEQQTEAATDLAQHAEALPAAGPQDGPPSAPEQWAGAGTVPGDEKKKKKKSKKHKQDGGGASRGVQEGTGEEAAAVEEQGADDAVGALPAAQAPQDEEVHGPGLAAGAAVPGGHEGTLPATLPWQAHAASWEGGQAGAAGGSGDDMLGVLQSPEDTPCVSPCLSVEASQPPPPPLQPPQLQGDEHTEGGKLGQADPGEVAGLSDGECSMEAAAAATAAAAAATPALALPAAQPVKAVPTAEDEGCKEPDAGTPNASPSAEPDAGTPSVSTRKKKKKKKERKKLAAAAAAAEQPPAGDANGAGNAGMGAPKSAAPELHGPDGADLSARIVAEPSLRQKFSKDGSRALSLGKGASRQRSSSGAVQATPAAPAVTVAAVPGLSISPVTAALATAARAAVAAAGAAAAAAAKGGPDEGALPDSEGSFTSDLVPPLSARDEDPLRSPSPTPDPPSHTPDATLAYDVKAEGGGSNSSSSSGAPLQQPAAAGLRPSSEPADNGDAHSSSGDGGLRAQPASAGPPHGVRAQSPGPLRVADRRRSDDAQPVGGRAASPGLPAGVLRGRSPGPANRLCDRVIGPNPRGDDAFERHVSRLKAPLPKGQRAASPPGAPPLPPSHSGYLPQGPILPSAPTTAPTSAPPSRVLRAPSPSLRPGTQGRAGAVAAAESAAAAWAPAVAEDPAAAAAPVVHAGTPACDRAPDAATAHASEALPPPVPAAAAAAPKAATTSKLLLKADPPGPLTAASANAWGAGPRANQLRSCAASPGAQLHTGDLMLLTLPAPQATAPHGPPCNRLPPPGLSLITRSKDTGLSGGKERMSAGGRSSIGGRPGSRGIEAPLDAVAAALGPMPRIAGTADGAEDGDPFEFRPSNSSSPSSHGAAAAPRRWPELTPGAPAVRPEEGAGGAGGGAPEGLHGEASVESLMGALNSGLLSGPGSTYAEGGAPEGRVSSNLKVRPDGDHDSGNAPDAGTGASTPSDAPIIVPPHRSPNADYMRVLTRLRQVPGSSSNSRTASPASTMRARSPGPLPPPRPSLEPAPRPFDSTMLIAHGAYPPAEHRASLALLVGPTSPGKPAQQQQQLPAPGNLLALPAPAHSSSPLFSRGSPAPLQGPSQALGPHSPVYSSFGDVSSGMAPPRSAAAAQKHAQRMRMRSMSPDPCPASVRGGFAPGAMARSGRGPGGASSLKDGGIPRLMMMDPTKSSSVDGASVRSAPPLCDIPTHFFERQEELLERRRAHRQKMLAAAEDEFAKLPFKPSISSSASCIHRSHADLMAWERQRQTRLELEARHLAQTQRALEDKAALGPIPDKPAARRSTRSAPPRRRSMSASPASARQNKGAGSYAACFSPPPAPFALRDVTSTPSQPRAFASPSPQRTPQRPWSAANAPLDSPGTGHAWRANRSSALVSPGSAHAASPVTASRAVSPGRGRSASRDPPHTRQSQPGKPPKAATPRSKSSRQSSPRRKKSPDRGKEGKAKGIEDVWNWECGEAALNAAGLGMDYLRAAAGEGACPLRGADRLCAQHMSMGQLLSKLEAEAEAVQLVALTKHDEQCFIAKYLQAKWFLRAARIAADSGKSYAAEDAQHGQHAGAQPLQPPAAALPASGNAGHGDLQLDPEDAMLARGLQALEEGPGPTPMFSIAAWVAHARTAESDLQAAATAAREGLNLSSSQLPQPTSTTAPPLSRALSRNASPTMRERGPHLQLPHSPSLAILSSRRLEEPPPSVAASRRLRAQQSQGATSPARHLSHSNTGMPSAPPAQQQDADDALEGGTEAPLSVYQKLLRSTSKRGAGSPSPARRLQHSATLAGTSPLNRQLQRSFTAAASPHAAQAPQREAEVQPTLPLPLPEELKRGSGDGGGVAGEQPGSAAKAVRLALGGGEPATAAAAGDEPAHGHTLEEDAPARGLEGQEDWEASLQLHLSPSTRRRRPSAGTINLEGAHPPTRAAVAMFTAQQHVLAAAAHIHELLQDIEHGCARFHESSHGMAVRAASACSTAGSFAPSPTSTTRASSPASSSASPETAQPHGADPGAGQPAAPAHALGLEPSFRPEQPLDRPRPPLGGAGLDPLHAVHPQGPGLTHMRCNPTFDWRSGGSGGDGNEAVVEEEGSAWWSRVTVECGSSGGVGGDDEEDGACSPAPIPPTPRSKAPAAWLEAEAREATGGGKAKGKQQGGKRKPAQQQQGGAGGEQGEQQKQLQRQGTILAAGVLQGVVSASHMARTQRQLAKLPPGPRRQALLQSLHAQQLYDIQVAHEDDASLAEASTPTGPPPLQQPQWQDASTPSANLRQLVQHHQRQQLELQAQHSRRASSRRPSMSESWIEHQLGGGGGGSGGSRSTRPLSMSESWIEEQLGAPLVPQGSALQSPQQQLQRTAAASPRPPASKRAAAGGERGQALSRMASMTVGLQQLQQQQQQPRNAEDEQLGPWSKGHPGQQEDFSGLAAAAVAAVAEAGKADTSVPHEGADSGPSTNPSALATKPGCSSAYEALLHADATRKRNRHVQNRGAGAGAPPRSSSGNVHALAPLAKALPPLSAAAAAAAAPAPAPGGPAHKPGPPAADKAPSGPRQSAGEAPAPPQQQQLHQQAGGAPGAGEAPALVAPMVTSFSLMALSVPQPAQAQAPEPPAAAAAAMARAGQDAAEARDGGLPPTPAAGTPGVPDAAAVRDDGALPPTASSRTPSGAQRPRDAPDAGTGDAVGPVAEPAGSIHPSSQQQPPPQQLHQQPPKSALRTSLTGSSAGATGLAHGEAVELQAKAAGKGSRGVSWSSGDGGRVGDDALEALEATLRTVDMGAPQGQPDDLPGPSAADYWLEDRTPQVGGAPATIPEESFEWAFLPSNAGSTWGGGGGGTKLASTVTAASTELTASAVRALEARLDQLMIGIKGAVQIQKQISKYAAMLESGQQPARSRDALPLGLFTRPNEKGINKGMGPPITGPASLPLHPYSRTPPSTRPSQLVASANHPASPQHPSPLPMPSPHQPLDDSPLPASAAAAAAAAAAARQSAPPPALTASQGPATPAASAARARSTGSGWGGRCMEQAPDMPHIRSPARLVPITINISRPEDQPHAAGFSRLHPRRQGSDVGEAGPAAALRAPSPLRGLAAAKPTAAAAAPPPPPPPSAPWPGAQGARVGAGGPSPALVLAPTEQQPDAAPQPEGTAARLLSSKQPHPQQDSPTPSAPPVTPQPAPRAAAASSPSRSPWPSPGAAVTVASALVGAPPPGSPPRDLATLLQQVQALRLAAESGADPHALPAAWRALQQEVAAAVMAAQQEG